MAHPAWISQTGGGGLEGATTYYLAECYPKTRSTWKWKKLDMGLDSLVPPPPDPAMNTDSICSTLLACLWEFFLFSNVYMYKVPLDLVTKWCCTMSFITNEIRIMLRHSKLLMSDIEAFSKHLILQNGMKYLNDTQIALLFQTIV